MMHTTTEPLIDRVLPYGATVSCTVPPHTPAQRLDTFLAQTFPGHSRSFFQKLIAGGFVRLATGGCCKASMPVVAGSELVIVMPEPHKAIQPEHPDIDALVVPVVYSCDDFIIINKPAGLIVHTPADAHKGVTLVDWLIARYPELRVVGELSRPGIVHRLDRDTSGLMIIPRTMQAHAAIGELFRLRKIHKTYVALVDGHPPASGAIDLPIARHSIDRLRMTHQNPAGRSALTHFTVLNYYARHSFVQFNPVTGRTHQIRVHSAAVGHPLVGDVLYGRKSAAIDRQALHACALSFVWRGDAVQVTEALPPDFLKAQAQLAALSK